MTIFSMLFGAGIFFMTSRIEAAGQPSAGLHYRRMGWLTGLGLAHAYLLCSGDILVTFGMCGMVAYVARKLRPRILLIMGLLTIAVASGTLTAYGLWSRHWNARDVQMATEDLWKPTPAEVAKEIKAYRGTWSDQMKFRVHDSARMETNVFVGFTFWRVTGLTRVGMALFKLGFFSARRRAPDHSMMIAIVLAAGIPLILYGMRRDFVNGCDFRYSFFYGAQFSNWGSILVSLGWVGAMMLASRAVALLVLTRRLAAVGRMAFTNYIMHTLICTTSFGSHGFGMFGKVERIRQFAIVVTIWAVQLIYLADLAETVSVWSAGMAVPIFDLLPWEPFRRHLTGC